MGGRPLILVFAGIRSLAGWYLHVDNGAPCFVWASRRLEGVCSGRKHRALPCLLVCELVLRVKCSWLWINGVPFFDRCRCPWTRLLASKLQGFERRHQWWSEICVNLFIIFIDALQIFAMYILLLWSLYIQQTCWIMNFEFNLFGVLLRKVIYLIIILY